jgi:GxxExxY protein
MDAEKSGPGPHRPKASGPGGELTERVIAASFAVYRELGAGFLESVYVAALRIALRDAGLAALHEAQLPAWFRGQRVGEFRADLLIEGKLVVEVKACPALSPAHQAQLINYLRAAGIPLGLLLNFGPKPGIKRVIWSRSAHGGASGGQDGHRDGEGRA